MNKNKKTFYITTPIYYASGNLHIGHLYTTTLAWTIANYKKSRGYDVKFLTGSDEHGQKIFLKAQEANISAQKYVDDLVKNYKKMWSDFGIDYDYFSRTTNQNHKETIQQIFELFLKKGIIYNGNYEGLYSVSDEEFFTKTQAVKGQDGNYYHPLSNHKLSVVKEESYFFKMSEFQEWLKLEILNNPTWLNPQKVINELNNNFISKGLEDLSVTRSNVSWGIKTLSDPKHTIYVWLDALCNYISALGFNLKSNTNTDFEKYWQNGDEIVHLLGKEISRFHFIYWPIFLKALDIKMPSKMISHGWIITPTGKMSKSKNNVIDPYDLLAKYHPEMIKYFFVSKINLGEDGVFDIKLFEDTINSELINNYGNLVSRTLKMISNSFDNGIKHKKSDDNIHKNIDTAILESKEKFIKYFDEFNLSTGLKVAIDLGNTLNKYIDETTPWKLTDRLDELELILSRLLNGIYAMSTYLKVVMPQKMNEVSKALNIEFDLEQVQNFEKFDNKKMESKFLFFQRIK
ncbi:methionine--tRNA ligase [Mycoplasmopsis alligatoris]|uniref:Methionine--tRNA ligase n=1 Tax=Mycoplasmopsis alligatoris A21JP2 TaxID=747682 RepID=D4XWV6_9BACT|nr:methionine--tRNA ligase [Mycoplasmopsis alligatoris]EFF41296.1 methionine--tRNA ligase [Mycoplasmopsis alligatoris A21JP2]